MPEEICKVCGRATTARAGAFESPEYSLIFNGTCHSCGVTLNRALGGLVILLRESHGEHRERVISKLIDKLNTHGFDTAPFHRRAG